MKALDSQLTKDKVVAELRKAILYGEYDVGEALYQDKIADELGVSRMPVREALQVLHNEGLITVKPNKVAYVNEVSTKFLFDHFNVRVILEKEAIRLACLMKPDCTDLWNYYNMAENAINHGDIVSFNDANRSIHSLIWHYSNNIVLERILSQLWNNSILDTVSPLDQARISNDDHKKMIHSIENTDINASVSIAEIHVNRSYQRILDRLNNIK